IRLNSEYLLQLIDDILDFSKIEAGKLTTEMLSCSPHALLSEVASLMRVQAASRSLALTVQYTGTIPERIQTDPTRLRQILINLVGNAIKFTSSGEVTIRCQLERSGDDPGGFLVFDVCDTGIGMRAEEIEQLFQPFAQADNSTTRRFGGTGLGLAISYRLAQALGGRIEVESEVGVGSRFRVYVATGPLENVRLLQQAPGTEQEKRFESASSTANKSLLEGRRILVAEDGSDNQYLISFYLRRAGAEVEVVENGRLAVERACSATDSATPVDVILMDMQMPEMDGYTATAQLRKRGFDRPIIALTAH